MQITMDNRDKIIGMIALLPALLSNPFNGNTPTSNSKIYHF